MNEEAGNDLRSTRVLIIDDHPCVRSSLAQILYTLPEYTIAGQAGTLKAALAATTETRPDLILLDLLLPDATAPSSLQQLRSVDSNVRIVIFTGSPDTHLILKTLRHEPEGFLNKACETKEILRCLSIVAAGGRYFCSTASASLHRCRKLREMLTEREYDVLQLVASGSSSKQIANALGLAPRTVEVHRRVLMAKLNVSECASLVRVAIESGLLRE